MLDGRNTTNQELKRPKFSSGNALAEGKPYMAARALSLIAKDDLPVTWSSLKAIGLGVWFHGQSPWLA